MRIKRRRASRRTEVVPVLDDEPYRTLGEAVEYVASARLVVDEFANEHPEVTVYHRTVTSVIYTVAPTIVFMVWIPEFTHGAAVLEFNPTGTADEMQADLIRSLNTARVGLKNLWFNPFDDEANAGGAQSETLSLTAEARAIAFAVELAGALDSAQFSIDEGGFRIDRTSENLSATFDVVITAGDRTRHSEQRVDLRAPVADSVAAVVAGLTRQRTKLLTEGDAVG
jgi:hypothetical protein